MSIKKIISANSVNFEKWDQMLVEHYERMYYPENFSNEDKERVFFQSNELLMAIAENFFSYGRFKDSWDTSKCYINYLGQNLILRSEKTDITYYWGLDGNNFYLESSIMYPENIRYMTDDFWSALLQLKTYGTFDYSGSGYLSGKERTYFENKTSTVFQLARNFMLFQFEEMERSPYERRPSMDAGRFTLKWDSNTDFEELLEKTCQAFKALYSINYQLWKISDLAKKKAMKGKV